MKLTILKKSGKLVFYILLFTLRPDLVGFDVFAQTPTQQWVARYLRPSGSSGLRNYMALDKIGGCYVAGDYLDQSNDVVIIKYDANGIEQWARTYQGSSSAVDIPYGILADSTGNNYTTLSSGINFGPYDIITIKYSPQGVQQWLKVYDSGTTDEPRDIAMDRSGNVYVGGLSGDQSIIIKYNPSGDTLWVRKYFEAGYRFPGRSIAIDNQNNVIIGGTRVTISNGATEYYTIKYDSNGFLQWVRTTTFNAITSLVKVSTDLSGNVIATGKSLSGRIVTVKYDFQGTLHWQRLYTGPVSGSADPYDMEIDNLGNIVIAGSSWGVGSFSDYVTIKYNSSGDSLWIKRYNGTGNDDDIAYSLDLDDSNNVYITGRSINMNTSWDYVTIKYDSNGNQRWMTTYNNLPVNAEDIAYCIIVDSGYNVYVTGSSRRFVGGPSDYLTIRYSQPLAIINLPNEIPFKYELKQNFPNPFNPSSKIKFSIPKMSFVQINIYDILGRIIEIPVNEKLQPSEYVLPVDASNYSSGVYFYQLIADSKIIDTKKMIVLK